MDKKTLRQEIEEREESASKLIALAVSKLGEGYHHLRRDGLIVDYSEFDAPTSGDEVFTGTCRDLEVKYDGEMVLRMHKLLYLPGEWERAYKNLLSSPRNIAVGKRNQQTYKIRLRNKKELEERAKKVGL
jgi:hypothetical protein